MERHKRHAYDSHASPSRDGLVSAKSTQRCPVPAADISFRHIPARSAIELGTRNKTRQLSLLRCLVNDDALVVAIQPAYCPSADQPQSESRRARVGSQGEPSARWAQPHQPLQRHRGLHVPSCKDQTLPRSVSNTRSSHHSRPPSKPSRSPSARLSSAGGTRPLRPVIPQRRRSDEATSA